MSHTVTLTREDLMLDLEKQQCFNTAESNDVIITVDTSSRATTAVSADTNNGSKLPPTRTKEEEAAVLKAAKRETESTITVALQKYPHGYPLLAAFQSSESSFSIYRSFDYLHSRVILELQDELRELEDGLAILDKSDERPERKKCLTSRTADRNFAKREKLICSKRSGMLATIREKLVNYDELMIKARELNAFQRPSKRDYFSLRRWFFNKKPLNYHREEEFVKRKEDLITLRHGREWAGFDGWVEDCVRKLPKKWSRWLFTTPEQRDKTDDECINYYSPARIERLVGLIITFIIFILLVLPVMAMYKLTSVGDRNSTFDAVGILVVFTLLFSAAMSLMTKAKRQELFAASAAYCAVLVVFISNFGSNGASFGGGRGN